MTSNTSKTMWWLKSNAKPKTPIFNESHSSKNRNSKSEEVSSSLADFLEKERDLNNIISDNTGDDVDIESILDEINRISVKSSLGPIIQDDDRPIDDILKEAEKIYMETSKSFDQLSQRSRTSQNLTDVFNSFKSDESTPTPKSISPLPFDEVEVKTPVIEPNKSIQSIYSLRNMITYPYKENLETPVSDVLKTSQLKTRSNQQGKQPLKENVNNNNNISNNEEYSADFNTTKSSTDNSKNNNIKSEIVPKLNLSSEKSVQIEEIQENYIKKDVILKSNANENVENLKREIAVKDEKIQNLLFDNEKCKMDISQIEKQIQQYQYMLKQAAGTFQNKTPSENLNTTRTFEELKDVQEQNMSLHIQLKKFNESNQLLKQSHDEILTINKSLENRIFDMDSSIIKFRDEVIILQNQTQKLTHKEIELADQLHAEKVQVKSFQNQIEKDAKCIMDLNRQIKEMERIIQRKHPDSVSSLIVASKTDIDLPSRKVLEDRIKVLEAESSLRSEQNSKVFLDVQDKFNQMKHKYESHIEDLELHVADLKAQMKNRIDTYDVYTQTITMKTKTSVDNLHSKTATVHQKKIENKDSHLLATIRGLQADLLNKDRATTKLQKELDELKKTNRRLQKEREGSLKNLCVKQHETVAKKDNPVGQEEKQRINDIGQSDFIEKIKELKSEKERMQKQLCKIENDFQELKRKRIEDLTKLQEAHEEEISNYLTNMAPLREQLEIQQISLNSLQQQLTVAKEELSVTSVERDHLNNKLQLQNSTALVARKMEFNIGEDPSEINHLRKKMSSMEVMYADREERLRAIIHGLAQKNIMNRNCDQCANRQQQLIGYKAELDQLIATVRCLQ